MGVDAASDPVEKLALAGAERKRRRFARGRAGREPHAVRERLDDDVIFEQACRLGRPVLAGKQHVGVEPGHLVAVRRNELDPDVQQSLLLPEHVGAAKLHQLLGVVGPELERCVAEGQLDRKKRHSCVGEALAETQVVLTLRRVAGRVVEGRHRPQGAGERLWPPRRTGLADRGRERAPVVRLPRHSRGCAEYLRELEPQARVELPDDADLRVAGDQPCRALEVVAQVAVVVEPPERWPGEQQMRRTGAHERPKVGDRGVAVLRVEAGPAAVLDLGKVSAVPATKAKQLVVAAAHDQNVRVGRDNRLDELPQTPVTTSHGGSRPKSWRAGVEDSEGSVAERSSTGAAVVSSRNGH